MPLVYATVDDLTAWLPPTIDVPDDAERWLERASGRLRRMLLTAVYDVGPSGLPTDPEVAKVLSNATCALVEYRLANSDDGTGGSAWTTMSAGPVSLARAAADPVIAGVALPESALDAFAVLTDEQFRWGAVSTGRCGRW
jgi:hypothetical protein